MEIKATLILSLGSNLGDRIKNIEDAYLEIEREIGKILNRSSFYENEAVGFTSEDLFLNTCIEVSTVLTPEAILEAIQQIELKLGRTEKSTKSGYTSRLIDIDIIFFNDLVLNSESLTIPHKLFRNRPFVLVPLLEVAKTRIDPITQLSVNQISKLIDY